jgi:release factor glutamine methyltransferase
MALLHPPARPSYRLKRSMSYHSLPVSDLGSLHALALSARERFIRAGIPPDQAAIDAEVLARYVTRWDRATYLARRHQSPSIETRARLDDAFARREQRVPVAYITGVREFWGLEFHVSPAVLIPRPETEFVVETAIRRLPDRANPWRVADIGTGSGCLAVSLARELPAATVLATDISSEALSVASDNAERLGVLNRISFRLTSLLEGIPGPFDLIVANPPYVPEAFRGTLSPDVRDHEPAVALFGSGEDGLDQVRALLSDVPSRLVSGGSLLMEFGFEQGDAIRGAARSAGLVVIEVLRDLQGHERTLVAQRT